MVQESSRDVGVDGGNVPRRAGVPAGRATGKDGSVLLPVARGRDLRHPMLKLAGEGKRGASGCCK
jgi:hypothetical protein